MKGLKRYTDRHGKLRLYHRRTGTPIDPALSDIEIAAEVARLDRGKAPQEAAKPGTLGGLLESYRRSPRFTGKAERTKADYLKIMDYLKPLAETPLAAIGQGFMAKLRDKTLARKRAGFTNHMIAMLSSAFKHGVEYELIEKNPCAELANAEMTTDRRRPNRAWTAVERQQVLAAAPDKLRLPLALARFLGLRRGDICRLPRSAYRAGWLEFRAGKNNKLMRLPALGELKREIETALATAPTGDSTVLCLNTRGEPWTPGGLSHEFAEFFKECRGHGIMGPKGSLHGLRHSIGAELRAAGYTAEQRQLILGHDTTDMAEHYAASAEVSGELIDMANVLQGRPKREHNLTNQRRANV